jgi:hypothetical protein
MTTYMVHNNFKIKSQKNFHDRYFKAMTDYPESRKYGLKARGGGGSVKL